MTSREFIGESSSTCPKFGYQKLLYSEHINTY